MAMCKESVELGLPPVHPQNTKRKARSPKTPISRRKSLTEKIDLPATEEDLKRDDEERLEEVIENLSSWMTQLLGTIVNPEEFLPMLKDGVILCIIANKIQNAAVKYKAKNPGTEVVIPRKGICKYHKKVEPNSFHARENITKFVRWAEEFGVEQVLLFDSEELINYTDGKKIANCLLSIARKTKLFMPTLDVEVSRMVAVLRDLHTLLGDAYLKEYKLHHDKEQHNLNMAEKGFWKNIQSRIMDTLKNNDSKVKGSSDSLQDMHMLKLLACSQIGKEKLENTIEQNEQERRKSIMLKVLQNSARKRFDEVVTDGKDQLPERLDCISDDNSSQGSSEDYNAVIDAALKLLTGEENGAGEVDQTRFCCTSVRVPVASRKMSQGIYPVEMRLSPEQFFFGNNKPRYEDLTLELFMQGYTALLADERLTEIEQRGRLSLLQTLFREAPTQSWPMLREFHRVLVEKTWSGERRWSDDITQFAEDFFKQTVITPQELPPITLSCLGSPGEGSIQQRRLGNCCSSCGGRTPLRQRRTTPLTVRKMKTEDGNDYEVEVPSSPVLAKLKQRSSPTMTFPLAD